MDLNGWLTVITILIAIVALIPKEERKIIILMTSPLEKWALIGTLMVVIPILIVFPKLVSRWEYLGRLGFTWGFAPENIAFSLFYVCLIWLIIHLFNLNSNAKVDNRVIEYFGELLNEKSFEEFFKLFTKYTSRKVVDANWDDFKELIFHPKFLNRILELQPSYLLQYWDRFSNENDFRLIFRSFLKNQNSAYYTEIREHWNSYSVLEDKPFLTKLIKDNLRQSIDNGILKIFSDYVSKQLQAAQGKTSIYNQPHNYLKIKEEEGFNLPVHYHICFIGLLYSSAIKNKINISSLSNRYGNMQFIYSSMIEKIINNIVVDETNENHEYPTNYHWLIKEIFSFSGNWLTTFSDERYFSASSSYMSFIPNSLSHCMDELYKGFKKGKISQDFINGRMYYDILSNYFSCEDELKVKIEEKIIHKIPKENLEDILDFSLDEAFAVSFNDFKDGHFPMNSQKEKEVLNRLLSFLQNNNLL